MLAFICGLLALLPRRLQLFCGFCVGELAFWSLVKRRKITIANLEKVFPERNAWRLARETYHHFGKNLIELFLLPHSRTSFKKWIRFVNPERFDLAASGKGVIMLTAHFGNWETLGCVSQLGHEVYGLYQKQKQLDQLILQLRQGSGARLIEKKQALKSGLKALKNNHVLGHVGDQGKGLELSFFGFTTNFPAGPVRIAMKTGSTILFTVCIRRGLYLDIEVLEQIELQNSGTDEEIVYNTMSHFAASLQDMVCQYPEQYFWMHDLWRMFKK